MIMSSYHHPVPYSHHNQIAASINNLAQGHPSTASSTSTTSVVAGTNPITNSTIFSPKQAQLSIVSPPISNRASSPEDSSSIVSNSIVPTSGPKRARVTGSKLAILLSEYDINPNPSPDSRKLIAAKVGLAERSVRIWFQNRRAKNRKEQRERDARGGHGLMDPSVVTGSSRGIYNSLTAPHDLGRVIPVHINHHYDFIHANSITIGAWQRIKQDSAINHHFQPQLLSLSPISVEALMSDPLDLAIIYSKKDQEINYFFTSYNKGQKILFRIYFSLADCHSVTCNGIDKVSSSYQTSVSSPTTPTSSSSFNPNPSPLNSELTLCLSNCPRFAVYFTFPDTNSPGSMGDARAMWTPSEDFSVDHQVRNAYFGVGGKSIPHKIVGRTVALKILEQEITKYIDCETPHLNNTGINNNYTMSFGSGNGAHAHGPPPTGPPAAPPSHLPPAAHGPPLAMANNTSLYPPPPPVAHTHHQPQNSLSSYSFPSAITSSSSEPSSNFVGANFGSNLGSIGSASASGLGHGHSGSMYSLASPASTPTSVSVNDFYGFNNSSGNLYNKASNYMSAPNTGYQANSGYTPTPTTAPTAGGPGEEAITSPSRSRSSPVSSSKHHQISPSSAPPQQLAIPQRHMSAVAMSVPMSHAPPPPPPPGYMVHHQQQQQQQQQRGQEFYYPPPQFNAPLGQPPQGMQSYLPSLQPLMAPPNMVAAGMTRMHHPEDDEVAEESKN
ncbi:Pho2 protein [Saccharomycopsis crataegensis]|uniref:Pho2 protein n=1 Tax=Saccharomycopsis crataegensis TaxID=43959 RepID=A0AAV5QF59_9ASCO|nr:Pho2 protein [Saccharomycopsis crataegensis]